jgi:hypothetical protein
MQWEGDLDGTRVNDSLLVIKTLGDRIFGYDGLSSTSMSGYQNTLISLYSIDRDFLEGIQLKLVLSIRF